MKVGQLALAVGIAGVTVSSVARADEPAQRIVTYIDGPVPRLQVLGDQRVPGAVEVEVVLSRTNPLCFAYSIGPGGANPARATPQEPAWSRTVSSARGTVTYESVDGALAAIDQALAELGALSMEASSQASIEAVWNACLRAHGGTDVLAEQRRAVAHTETLMLANLAPDGAWTVRLLSAMNTAASLRKQQSALMSGVQGELDVAASVRRLSSSLQLLDNYIVASLALIDRLQQDIKRAQWRLASAPVGATFQVRPGSEVAVEVSRWPLQRGELVSDAVPLVTRADAYVTLEPRLFDLGIGPALTLKNTQGYGLAVRGDNRTADVVRTDDDLNTDVIVSLSMYVWGRRYLDDEVFAASHLLPRPMIGVSLGQPLTSIYGGIQLDPIQFLDVSFGIRAYSTEHLIKPDEGRRAYVDAEDEPAEPVTRTGVTTQMFVSLTASTHLLERLVTSAF